MQVRVTAALVRDRHQAVTEAGVQWKRYCLGLVGKEASNSGTPRPHLFIGKIQTQTSACS